MACSKVMSREATDAVWWRVVSLVEEEESKAREKVPTALKMPKL